MTDSGSEVSDVGYSEVMKIFASEDEIDASFSGFSRDESTSSRQIKKSETEKHVEPRDGNNGDEQASTSQVKTGGKGPGQNKKGKAPLKRKNSQPEDKPPKKKSKKQRTVDAVSDTLKTLFAELTSKITVPQPVVAEPHVVDNIDNSFDGPSTSGENFHNMFSECEANEIAEGDNDDFDFEMPKNIFEDEEKFSEEVSSSISKMIERITKNKSDVTSLIKKDDNKIPANCKGLCPPVVNPEIWQNLDRRTRTQDLLLQSIQRLIGLGIVPLIRIGVLLKNKNCNLSELRELVQRSVTILSNAMFEASIKRRIMLKPRIDRRFHQLTNRNEPVGSNLFGDDVSRRLKEINEAHKMNRSLSSKNYQGQLGQGQGRYTLNSNRYYNRGASANRGGAYSNLYMHTAARTRPYNRLLPKGCRQQAFQKKF